MGLLRVPRLNVNKAIGIKQKFIQFQIGGFHVIKELFLSVLFFIVIILILTFSDYIFLNDINTLKNILATMAITIFIMCVIGRD